MKLNIEIALWNDCETDDDRVKFLRSGRAIETGIIAPAIVEDVAQAFEFRASYCRRKDNPEKWLNLSNF